jgi:two-component system response regulator VicR
MAIKVLAVDDEASVLQLVTVKLKKAGFEVISARDGDEAVTRALNEKPNVVLLDVMMPKLDGFTAAARIKAEVNPPPLVLMLTAKGETADISRAFASGADDYVTKPFSPRELIERIKVGLIRAGWSPADV